ncbi:MAG: nitroreductase family deazaflavin-dependent oxidoreductase [Actinomycetota bacterium]
MIKPRPEPGRGVQSALAYHHSTGNPIHRGLRAIAGSKPGAWFFSKTIQPMDGAVLTATKGRTTLSELLAGLPVLNVTTTGRKSGEPRTAPLIAVPIGDDLALLGTNFGGQRTPAWVYNLEANPNAVAEYRTVEVPVVARPATDEEYEQVFAAGGSIYGGYTKYRSRADHRDIRVFILERA